MLLAGYGSSSDESTCDEKVVPEQRSLQNETAEEQTSPNTTANETQPSPIIAQPVSTTAEPDTEKPAPVTKPTRSCRFFFRYGKCRNGDACRFSHEIPPPPRQPNNGSQHHNNHPNRKRKRGGPTSSDTLLRKLLENDMDRESTLTMQLLKYIVSNNFFMGDDAVPNTKTRK